MPRLYLTPAELLVSPLYLGISQYLTQLPAGSVDLLLMRASERVDQFCQKRLQAPGSSTLTANALATATSISVASTLTIDNLAEQAVRINPGGANEETVLIMPGGVTVTNSPIIDMPYPGTITLASPLSFGHNSGETVQYVYKEVTEAGSSSSSDPYTEALQTQAMQLALAHLPPARTALTRVIFLKSYPIINIYEIEHAFSFVNQFNLIDLNIESVVHAEGWYRMNVGSVILREGLMRTTYTGGFQVVPDDIKHAASLYFAEQVMQAVNPFGLTQLTMGKRTQRWDTSKAKHFLVEEAEDILKKYRRIM